ncbi:hypothetical protein K3495_g5815 [Podosphaera aphanis]|nr:hypothetical protein K3495_g5815 [Podosphaera aphanis]
MPICQHAYNIDLNSPPQNELFTDYSAAQLGYTEDKFMGVLIDTGASSRSTAGYKQFGALQKLCGVKIDEEAKGTVNVHFGIGSTSSIGSIQVVMPIGTVEFHVFNVDTLFLLCLKDMNNLRVYYDNIKNIIVTPTKTVPLGKWDGPFKLLNVEGETCTINLPYGPTRFRSTSVKHYLIHQNIPNTINTNKEISSASEISPNNGLTIASETTPSPSPSTNSQPLPTIQSSTVSETSHQYISHQNVQSQTRTQSSRPKRNVGRPHRYLISTNLADITVFLNEEAQFKELRLKEIDELMEKGAFEVIQLSNIPAGIRIFYSRFVDEVKFRGTNKAFEKSRLVVQAYNDHEKGLVLTQSLTVQRVSQRLILCMASCIPNTNLYLRDISQAYVKSATKLNRDFFIRPPPELKVELGLEENALLKAVKPLYGVPEAGNHWFCTYHNHHSKELFMTQSTFDSYLLYYHKPGLLGIVGLQTDDTFFLANDCFANEEQTKLKEAQFPAKEREKLTADHQLGFNGCITTPNSIKDILTLTQERQCKSQTLVDEAITTSTSSRDAVRSGLIIKDQYIAQRAKGAYIVSIS